VSVINYKQLIIVRKDLKMSPGKLAAQVSHGSMAFITNQAKQNNELITESNQIKCSFFIDEDVFTNWVNGAFTKIVLKARNQNHLLKSVALAKEIDLIEGRDYFLIKDNCLTELIPEDDDGRTLTVIGFRPLDEVSAKYISKHFNLYT